MEDIDNYKIKANIDDKILKAKEFKSKGNDFFKENDYKNSLRQYHRALMYLKGVECDVRPAVPFGKSVEISDKEEESINTLYTELQNNVAACLLKQNPIRYDRILICSEEAIKRQPRNLKATYRKALAHFHLQDYEKAKDSIKEADRIAYGKDSAVKNLANLIDSKIKEQERECMNLYKNSLLINSFN